MDLARADLRFPSSCGLPGDVGNSIGVGRFCETASDCRRNASATLCALIGDSTSYFCTLPCAVDAGAGQCGEASSCRCRDAECGCVPIGCDPGGRAP